MHEFNDLPSHVQILYPNLLHLVQSKSNLTRSIQLCKTFLSMSLHNFISIMAYVGMGFDFGSYEKIHALQLTFCMLAKLA